MSTAYKLYPHLMANLAIKFGVANNTLKSIYSSLMDYLMYKFVINIYSY